MSQEKLCLQWNDFQTNVSSYFRELKDDEDFTDVTLACEDGQQVEAHKIVLISSSPFFLNLLKRNRHPHPLIYMRGLKVEDLVSVIDFLYCGEANVFQDNLDSFLGIANELQLKGLKKEKKEDTEEKITTPINSFKRKAKTTSQYSKVSDLPPKPDLNQEDEKEAIERKKTILENNSDGNTDLDELVQTVKFMMTFSENQTKNQQRRARVCKICGKEGDMGNIMNHIEANHIANISIPCNACGKTLHTRSALAQHKTKCHSVLSC